MPNRRLADNRLPILTPVTPSGLLLTTTDTRMQKPNHLAHDPTVELAWWIEDPAIQFRITGKAYTIPTDPSEVQGVLDKIGLDGEDAKAEFWEDKRKDLWKNLSGHLRGSFGRPPPGKKLDEIEEKPEDWISRLDVESVSRACIMTYWVHKASKMPGRGEHRSWQDDPKQKKDIEWAQSHFALIAIKPENAEMLELKPAPNVRTQYNKQSDGSWEKVSVAP